MRKSFIATILLFSMLFSLTGCATAEKRQISCDEIIAAYEAEGYSVLYHGHDGDTVYNDNGIYCSFEIRDPDDEDNYMYVHRYFSEAEAKAACNERKFNPLLWLFFGIFGEWRWLHVKCYGDIEYETFDYKMLAPMNNLIFRNKFN